jgi:flagellar basal body-associated protein FliL
MSLGKTLMLAGVVLVAIGSGIGGTLGVMAILPLRTEASAKVLAQPATAKPIYFAEVSDVVVSIPADAGDPDSSFVQFAVQFSTNDQNAVASFAALQPIIKSDIINLLMSETGKSLQDPATRAALVKNCLAISNTVLAHNANYTPANPFNAAYITNLVVQD